MSDPKTRLAGATVPDTRGANNLGAPVYVFGNEVRGTCEECRGSGESPFYPGAPCPICSESNKMRYFEDGYPRGRGWTASADLAVWEAAQINADIDCDGLLVSTGEVVTAQEIFDSKIASLLRTVEQMEGVEFPE